MRVHSQEVPLVPEVGCAEVVTAERLHITRRSEARVQCRLLRAMIGAERMVEPTENLRLADGVAVGQSLVSDGEELVTVLVGNFLDKACKILASAELGTCEEMERPKESSESAETAAAQLPEGFSMRCHSWGMSLVRTACSLT